MQKKVAALGHIFVVVTGRLIKIGISPPGLPPASELIVPSSVACLHCMAGVKFPSMKFDFSDPKRL